MIVCRIVAICLFTSMVLVSEIFAQQRVSAAIKPTQITFNLVEPGIMMEKRMSEQTAIVVSTGLTSLFFYDSDLSKDSGFTINPFLRIGFRNYYPRKNQSKALNFNSGNYVGILGGYNFRSIAGSTEPGLARTERALYVCGVWGIQRNYKSGIHLGFSLGAGFFTGENENLGLTGSGSLEFGFVIR